MQGKIIGKYEILEPLGRGGSATVFKAFDRENRMPVAVKLLGRGVSSSVTRRFLLEAEILSRLDHPNIVRIYDIAAIDDYLLYSLQLIEGSDLANLIEESKRTGNPIAVKTAVSITLDLLDALHYLGRLGLYHRDIKPANILVDRNGRAYLGDFGLARFRDLTRLTRSGQAVGTLRYMSPEQLRGEDIDSRSDIYQAGLVLYELLYGRLPCCDRDSAYSQAMARAESEIDVPVLEGLSRLEPFGDIVRKACALDREARYATAEAMAKAIEEAAGQSNIGIRMRSFTSPTTELLKETSSLRISRNARDISRRLRVSRGRTDVTGRQRRTTKHSTARNFLAGFLPGMALAGVLCFGGMRGSDPVELLRADVSAGRFAAAMQKLLICLEDESFLNNTDRHVVSSIVERCIGALDDTTEGPATAAALVEHLDGRLPLDSRTRQRLSSLLLRRARRLAEDKSSGRAVALLRKASAERCLSGEGALFLVKASSATPGASPDARILACCELAACESDRPAELYKSLGRQARKDGAGLWARAFFERALEAAPNDIEIRVELASSLLHTPSPAAWFRIHELLDGDEPGRPLSAETRRQRLLCLACIDDFFHPCRSTFERLAQADRTNPCFESKLALARHYSYLGLSCQALPYFEQALEYRPSDLALLIDVWERKQASTSDEAVVLMSRITDIDPDLGNDLTRLNRFHQQENTPGSAPEFSVARRLHERFPSSSQAISILALRAIFKKDFARAQRLIDKGLDLAPDKPLLLVLKGDLQYAAGDVEAAAEMYEKAYRSEPHCYQAVKSLTTCYQKLERYDDLVSLYEKLYLERPTEERRVMNYEESLVLAGRTEDARKVLEKFLAIPVTELPPSEVFRGMAAPPPKVREALYRSGLEPRLLRVYLMTRKWDEALALCEKILERIKTTGHGPLTSLADRRNVTIVNEAERELHALAKFLREPPGGKESGNCPSHLIARRNSVLSRIESELDRLGKLSGRIEAALKGRLR